MGVMIDNGSLCVYVYKFVLCHSCVRAHVHACMCVCCAFVYVRVGVNLCFCLCVSVSVSVSMFAFVSVLTIVVKYVCLCVYVFVYVCVNALKIAAERGDTARQLQIFQRPFSLSDMYVCVCVFVRVKSSNGPSLFQTCTCVCV